MPHQYVAVLEALPQLDGGVPCLNREAPANFSRMCWVAVPPSVSFRMEVPTGWEQACFSPRHYSPDAQGRPSVRDGG